MSKEEMKTMIDKKNMLERLFWPEQAWLRVFLFTLKIANWRGNITV